MKNFFKISAIVLASILVLLFVGYAYVMIKYPDVGEAPDLKINATAEMIERGKYLSTTFASCLDCHSVRDYNKFAGPVVQGTEGKGGMDFGEDAGFVPAKNITSDIESGLGSWTDGEIFRAITMGVDRDGAALGPMMPYHYFREMDENDIKSIIAYIKTLAPIKNQVPEHSFNFPVNIIFRTLPEKPDFKKLPDPNNKVVLGEYYSGGCMACHSPMDKGEFFPDKLFSGGISMQCPKGGTIRSSNISPDKETGIGTWTKEQFIQKFRSYLSPEIVNVDVKEGEFNTVMPWTFYALATDDDLGAIYDFIFSHKPVKNKVEKFTPPSKYGN